jgi:hypothetical protein
MNLSVQAFTENKTNELWIECERIFQLLNRKSIYIQSLSRSEEPTIASLNEE